MRFLLLLPMPRHVFHSVIDILLSASRSQYCQKFLAQWRFLAGPASFTDSRKDLNSLLRKNPSSLASIRSNFHSAIFPFWPPMMGMTPPPVRSLPELRNSLVRMSITFELNSVRSLWVQPLLPFLRFGPLDFFLF
jgi:hypothetical protein